MVLTVGSLYYGPYKQDSTSTKRRLVLGQDQCTGCGTDGTSKVIGQGVAELYNRTQYMQKFGMWECEYITYPEHQCINILTYSTFTIGRSYVFKDYSSYLQIVFFFIVNLKIQKS